MTLSTAFLDRQALRGLPSRPRCQPTKASDAVGRGGSSTYRAVRACVAAAREKVRGCKTTDAPLRIEALDYICEPDFRANPCESVRIRANPCYPCYLGFTEFLGKILHVCRPLSPSLVHASTAPAAEADIPFARAIGRALRQRGEGGAWNVPPTRLFSHEDAEKAVVLR